MNNKYKILLIEDEVNIRNFVKTILEANDYQVVTASNGTEGKLMFYSHNPDVVILDLGLPDMDGLEFIKSVNNQLMTPIIVLSARTDEKDKVAALDYGANDYITKPFGTKELLARVRAVLRSSRQFRDKKAVSQKIFSVDGLEIDYEKRRVHVQGQEIRLTQTEYNIVAVLSENAGTVLTYQEIVRKVWGWSDSGSVKKLQVNMANIRKKLGEKPGDNKYIFNEIGIGYRMA